MKSEYLDRQPNSEACQGQFAPGVIDGPHRRRRLLSASQVDAIGRAALFMATLAAVAGTLGFTAGYFNLVGFLP